MIRSKLIDSKQVGRMLGCSSRSVQRLHKRGVLPSVAVFGGRRLRFSPATIARVLTELETVPAGTEEQ